ncbi:MAG: hypothetical protein GY835_18850, partial [bacterium]|nr:hypothetical protein [bacterium]
MILEQLGAEETFRRVEAIAEPNNETMRLRDVLDQVVRNQVEQDLTSAVRLGRLQLSPEKLQQREPIWQNLHLDAEAVKLIGGAWALHGEIPELWREKL